MNPQEPLQQRIDKIKQQIAALGDLHPGTLTQQYNVCGSPGCQCKSTPPVKHGPYHQLSFSRHGKSTSRFVREPEVPEVQKQLDNYRRLRQFVNEWITLSVELSSVRIQGQRKISRASKKNPNSRIPKENAQRSLKSKRRSSK